MKVNFYFVSFLFALLSSLRIQYLPELQTLFLIFYTISNKGISFKVLLLFIAIFCTHHYAIPDAVYREASSDYPSIYTKVFFGVKLLDFLTIFLLLFSVTKIYDNFFKIFQIRYAPIFLIVFSLLGSFYLNGTTFASDSFLFNVRDYIILIIVFVNCVKLTDSEFITISKLAIFSWILKMCFAILLPHPYPWYRTILGFDGIMFFAGDEYLGIPLYMSIIVAIMGKSISFKYVRNVILFTLLLALIAQRKGSIPVLLCYILLMYTYYNRNKLIEFLMKFYYLFNSLIIFLLLLSVNYLTSNELIRLAFLEYTDLAKSSLDSVLHLFDKNLFNAFFGITPFGKYEIMNIPSYVDSFMSFGTEAGLKYRYMLWSFPWGRCFLNTGLIGFLIIIVYSFRSIRYSPPLFYIIISSFSICYFDNLTPVNAVCMGIGLAFLYSFSHNSEKQNQEV